MADHPSHFPEYLAEFVGTACMVFFGLSFVVFDFAPGLPMSRWLPDHSLRLLITGLCFSGTGALVVISPLGRLSGGHINPSVSLAFWLHGKMRLTDFCAYVIAQILGGLLGALALAFVWGSYAASVKNGMTLPGAGWTPCGAFFMETGITALLVFLIFFFVSSQRLMRWTPLMTWILVAVMVWLEAPMTGTSLNPARSFGPAFVSQLWQDQWIYLVAPPLGGVVGLLLFNLCTPEHRRVLTGKLFHCADYRSLFHCDHAAAPSTPHS